MTGQGRPAALLAMAAVVAVLSGACGSTPPPSESPLAVTSTASPTPGPTDTPTASPSPSPSPTPSATLTPSPTPAPTPVPSIVPCPGSASRSAGARYPYTSTGFVGYAIGRAGANVTCVEATWTMPKTTCGSKDQGFTVSIGIDGWTSTEMHVKAARTLEVGTEASCIGGKLTDWAWHMASPEHTFQYFDELRPAVGDIIWAQIRYAGGTFTMSIRDKTTSVQVSIARAVAKIARVAARWEVSSESIGCDIKCRPVTLPKFAPVVFTSVDATMGGQRVAVGGASIIDVVEDATKNGVTRMVVSTIASSGRSFTVTWKHA